MLMFSVGINVKNIVITFIGAIRLEYFSKDVLTDLILSAFGILICNGFTSKKQCMSCLEQSKFV